MNAPLVMELHEGWQLRVRCPMNKSHPNGGPHEKEATGSYCRLCGHLCATWNSANGNYDHWDGNLVTVSQYVIEGL